MRYLVLTLCLIASGCGNNDGGSQPPVPSPVAGAWKHTQATELYLEFGQSDMVESVSIQGCTLKLAYKYTFSSSRINLTRTGLHPSSSNCDNECNNWIGANCSQGNFNLVSYIAQYTDFSFSVTGNQLSLTADGQSNVSTFNRN